MLIERILGIFRDNFFFILFNTHLNLLGLQSKRWNFVDTLAGQLYVGRGVQDFHGDELIQDLLSGQGIEVQPLKNDLCDGVSKWEYGSDELPLDPTIIGVYAPMIRH